MRLNNPFEVRLRASECWVDEKLDKNVRSLSLVAGLSELLDRLQGSTRRFFNDDGKEELLTNALMIWCKKVI
jgi:hypothetical protein